MTLQQLSAVTVPFMGQFIALSLIAMGTGNHEIVWTVRSALRQWDHVIDMVRLTNLFPAPVAFALLGFVLALYIVAIVSAKGSFEAGAAATSVRPRLFWMLFAVVPTVHLSLVRIFFPATCVLCLRFIGMPMRPTSNYGIDSLFVGLVANTLILSATSFAMGIESGCSGVRYIKILGSCRKFALTLGAALQGGVHSVSLSLNLMLSSAGGEINRSSVANLADQPHYISVSR